MANEIVLTLPSFTVLLKNYEGAVQKYVIWFGLHQFHANSSVTNATEEILSGNQSEFTYFDLCNAVITLNMLEKCLPVGAAVELLSSPCTAEFPTVAFQLQAHGHLLRLHLCHSEFQNVILQV